MNTGTDCAQPDWGVLGAGAGRLRLALSLGLVFQRVEEDLFPFTAHITLIHVNRKLFPFQFSFKPVTPSRGKLLTSTTSEL